MKAIHRGAVGDTKPAQHILERVKSDLDEIPLKQ